MKKYVIKLEATMVVLGLSGMPVKGRLPVEVLEAQAL